MTVSKHRLRQNVKKNPNYYCIENRWSDPASFDRIEMSQSAAPLFDQSATAVRRPISNGAVSHTIER